MIALPSIASIQIPLQPQIQILILIQTQIPLMEQPNAQQVLHSIMNN